MTDIGLRPPRGRLATISLPLLGVILAVAAWWIGAEASGAQTFILPTPLDVVQAYQRLPEYLFDQALVTLGEVLIGFGCAVVAGILVAWLIVSSSVLKRMFFPLIIGINAVPKLAIAPLLIFWLGFGTAPKIVMVLLMSFFPIVLSTVAGLTSTPSEMTELTRSLDASRWQTFVKVRAKWALPQVFVGLRIAISLAVIGAVVGEFVGGGNEGLGFVIKSSSASADTPIAFAAITLLIALSLVLYYLLVLVERLTLPWTRETTS
nr:ABC transporter permease [Micromonospora sp. DSM 115978]